MTNKHDGIMSYIVYKYNIIKLGVQDKNNNIILLKSGNEYDRTAIFE